MTIIFILILQPKTNKENLRIEKTALFVSQQGLQMEILIKAKQADNPQFSFLNKDDVLYAYYRHMLSAIKNGTYKVQTETEKGKLETCFFNKRLLFGNFFTEEKKEETAPAEYHEESYLHPSLQPQAVQSVGYRRDVKNCQFSLVLGDLKLCVAFVYGWKNKIVLHVTLVFLLSLSDY